VTQHVCESCKAPVHNLCFQAFVSQEYGKEDFDGDGFACKEHAEALGLKKVNARRCSAAVYWYQVPLFRLLSRIESARARDMRNCQDLSSGCARDMRKLEIRVHARAALNDQGSSSASERSSLLCKLSI
jgi:hypothetical protein